MCIPKGNIMKLTAKQLKRIIKEEVSAYRKEQLNEVDPAMIAGLQQAFILNPRAFRMVWSLIQQIPSIPSRWKELSAKQAKDKAASQDDPQLAKLLDAIGDFRGESFTDDEKDSIHKAHRGELDL
tara:strand:- start:18 stop:392 length:375 start_codon:yes stop_codon:yes gene_type:complete